MIRAAAPVALALSVVGWAWPAPAQPPASISPDPAACEPYRAKLEAITRAGDINAYIAAAGAIPETCPKLRETSRESVAEIRRWMTTILRSEEATEQSYRPDSSRVDEIIRDQSEADASAPSAAAPDRPKDTHPATEPPGSYDAPTSAGDQPPPR